MTYISITEARQIFEKLVEQVKAGEVFVITRYGKPAAIMCQPSPEELLQNVPVSSQSYTMSA